MRDLLLLGIETTCDETAAAVVRRRADGTGAILSNIVHSQTEDHAEYGGVVPEIAARAHVEVLDHLVARALRAAGLRLDEIDGIAAAAGPGLIGGVIVGLTTAKALALAANKPLVAVNHLEAHALTARLTDKVPFPFLLLLVSGGHTQLVAVTGIGEYEKLGGTMDDAIGEAFDKTAKMLGLPYPGGPAVERAALQGDPERFALPRPLHGKPVPDFSLSGLKTAVRIEALKIAPLSEQDVNDLCASFQAAVVDILADRVRCALRLMRHQGLKPSALVLAGGVGANQSVRRALHKVAADGGTRLAVPPPELCTDNGAMIAWAGAERLARGLHDGLDASPRARWPLGEIEGVGAMRAAAQAAEAGTDTPAAPPVASEGIGG
ncbi:tRNA (adenosine(37)-N6)-threonylcarbamoyltransferase complex transferase subunit TsaD [Ancylobacter polymorphus]|uniref:tRNA N6-adenosine threonylcarbamoyltransferase n=1 Tax=Ancylobacter polymorphus TaxID=223390 RepID=A0A9E6ZZ32_9HYPH|nr:tRNA (adenosine(37)-N6)-threonylcarbamoyltransferase complex transferase subunit TsaD [Ancylobacter polymorphus]UOK69223.1 tRNA (adenosine(37)-N6)-threonylcarbamoyltransferase complex transferase subunit TsaD [Ancylobacter polymorphus]